MNETAEKPESVLAVVNDLFFEAKIGEVHRTLGVPVTFAKSEGALEKRLSEIRPVLGIVDGSARGIDALSTIRRLVALGLPTIAFVSHVDKEATEAARLAGARAVYAKSGLVRELPEIVLAYAARLARRSGAADPGGG